MCSFGSDTVFTVYTDDEGPRETVGPGYDLEESVYGAGLGVLSYSVVYASPMPNRIISSHEVWMNGITSSSFVSFDIL